jgi:phosphatidylglycerol:prolipoprotein diacylglycerol transferase
MLYVGFVVGDMAGSAVAASDGLEPTRFAMAALVLLVPALIGARLWYAVENPRFFLAEPARLWRTQDGGAGLYGGLVLSFAVSAPVLAVADLDFWRFWDGAAVVMLIGMMITRVGCMMNGCCYGRETGGSFGLWLPDHHGQWQRRFPTQLLEAALSTVILVAELIAKPHLPLHGALFLTAAVAYAAGRLGLQLLRANTRILGASTQVNLAFSAVLIVIAGGTLVMRW